MLRLLKKILNARTHGLLRLRPAGQPLALNCLRELCPRPCCKLLGPPSLLGDEANVFPEQLIDKTGDNVRLTSCQSGGCVLFKAGNCQRYSHRPQGCHEYPWYRLGDELYYDAGCPGVVEGVEGRPQVSGIREFSTYLSSVSRSFRWLIRFWLCH